MNAYELADELENYVWMNPNNNRDYCKEVKDMLRQQADEIQALKDGFNTAWGGTNNSELAEVRAMANRMILKVKEQADRIAELEDRLSMYEIKDLDKPQIKKLSDQEIQSIWNEGIVGWYATQEESVLKFARAILKKASEK
jgi:hypothetical protein